MKWRQQFRQLNMIQTVMHVLSLVEYEDGEKRYILHPNGLEIGDSIIASETAANSIGNALPLSAMPLGVQVHNIEMHPKKGGQLVRSAGAVAQLVAKEGEFVTLRLPSGDSSSCFKKVLGYNWSSRKHGCNEPFPWKGWSFTLAWNSSNRFVVV